MIDENKRINASKLLVKIYNILICALVVVVILVAFLFSYVIIIPEQSSFSDGAKNFCLNNNGEFIVTGEYYCRIYDGNYFTDYVIVNTTEGFKFRK